MAQPINNNIIQPSEPQPKRNTGTGFTNLQRVLSANKNNQLGQTVGQGIQSSAQQTQQRLNQAQSNFQSEADKNRLGTEQDKQRVQSVLSDPSKATGEDISAFEKFRGGAYKGPQRIQDEQAITGQAQEAQQLGQLTGSQGGRQALLQRFVGGPQYGVGSQRLDSLLLGRENLAPARRETSGLVKQASQTAQNAQNIAQQYTNQAQGFGQDVTKQVEGKVTGAETDLDTKFKEAQDTEAKQSQNIAQIRELLGNPNVSGQTINAALQQAIDSGLIDKQVAEDQGILGVGSSIDETANFLKGGWGRQAGTGTIAASFNSMTPLQRLRKYLSNSYQPLEGIATSGRGNEGFETAQTLSNDLLKNFDYQQAQNLSRAGVADEGTRSNINALQQLAGRQAEFTGDLPQYQAGKANVNLDDILKRVNQAKSQYKALSDATLLSPYKG